MIVSLEKVKLKKKEEKPYLTVFNIQIPNGIIAEKENEVIDHYQSAARVNGFRRGKAPKDLVRKNFESQIRGDVLDKILRDLLPQIVKERSIEPVSSPAVSAFEMGEKFWSFDLVIEHRPEVKAKGYSKIAVKRKVKKIGDADVDKAIENIRNRYAELAPSQAAKAAREHFVVVSYTASVDGQNVADLSAENEMIELSSAQNIPGFSDGLLGVSKNEEKQLSVPFPKDHPKKELAGKTVDFLVKVHDIKERKLPAVDDEFAKDIGAESLSDLRQKLRESLEDTEKHRMENETMEQLEDHLLKENEVAPPPSLVEDEHNRLIWRALENQFGEAAQKITKEKFDEIKKNLKDDFKVHAEKRVKLGYIYDAVAQQENLSASDEDWHKDWQEARGKYPHMLERIDQYFSDRKEHIKAGITERKVINYIKDHAKIKEVSE